MPTTSNGDAIRIVKNGPSDEEIAAQIAVLAASASASPITPLCR